MNKIVLIGRLTGDTALKYTQNGKPVLSGSVAENNVRTSNGQKIEEVNFFHFSLFGPRAESLDHYMKKGTQVFLSGRAKIDKYQDKNGNNRESFDILVDDVVLLGSGQQKPEAASPYTNQRVEQPPTPPVIPGAIPDDFDDDIPF